MQGSEPEAHRSRFASLLLPTLPLCFYLLICGSLLLAILYENEGHFSFSLDDPYIHLALSEQIAKGHYGINPGEVASPASSVIWPFLLAPFARFEWQPYVALALNLFAGAMSAVLLGLTVLRWTGWRNDVSEWTRRVVSALLLVVVANLPGLTFIGMEHTLQVLLAIGCAWGIVACLQGQRIPLWCLVAAAVGPAVRYESLGLTAAVAVALWGQHRRRAAGLLLGVGLMPLLVFSAFLHYVGLPWLPTSVLIKAGALGSERVLLNSAAKTATWTTALRAFGQDKTLAQLAVWNQQLWHEGVLGLSDNRVLLLVLTLTLAGLAIREQQRAQRYALSGAALAAGLHLLVGRFGWFARYEVYVVIFSVLVILGAVQNQARPLLGWYVLGLMACASVYAIAIRDTPAATQDVYLQQYQMHRFVSDFYKGNVAVNDLGRVSYRRPPTVGVLDLVGLGSVESARQKNKSAAWLDAVTREHGTGVVMLYRTWYPEVPTTWTDLGQLCLLRKPVSVGDWCVSFYATGLDKTKDLQGVIDVFVKTLPPEVEWIAPTTPER